MEPPIAPESTSSDAGKSIVEQVLDSFIIQLSNKDGYDKIASRLKSVLGRDKNISENKIKEALFSGDPND